MHCYVFSTWWEIELFVQRKKGSGWQDRGSSRLCQTLKSMILTTVLHCSSEITFPQSEKYNYYTYSSDRTLLIFTKFRRIFNFLEL